MSSRDRLVRVVPGADVSLSVLATRCLHGASASSKILASSKSGVPKTPGGPAVNRGEQIASFSALALVAPETGKIARCSRAPKRPPPTLLPAPNACRKLASTPSVSRSNEAPAPRARSTGSPLLGRAFGYLEPLPVYQLAEIGRVGSMKGRELSDYRAARWRCGAGDDAPRL